MTWIKLDDKALRHPKIAGLSDRAKLAWLSSLCYASEFLTDGFLPVAFLVTVPRKVQYEIIAAGLWNDQNGHLHIHQYLEHQTSKASVEKERRRNRDRRTGGRTSGTTAGQTVGGTSEKPRPDTDTEVPKTQSTTAPPSVRGGGLILSPASIHRLQQTHAFVGVILRVPNVLHSELVSKSGASSDGPLRDWYQVLDAELERSGKGTGDIFTWLRPRHQAYAVTQGWIETSPKSTPTAAPVLTRFAQLGMHHRND